MARVCDGVFPMRYRWMPGLTG
ncbi:MAG: hypothetical protein FJ347_06775 [Sphingomonadales bacterium]|nr:hypothetical protein [Sphingomonadales bacterium]